MLALEMFRGDGIFRGSQTDHYAFAKSTNTRQRDAIFSDDAISIDFAVVIFSVTAFFLPGRHFLKTYQLVDIY